MDVKDVDSKKFTLWNLIGRKRLFDADLGADLKVLEGVFFLTDGGSC